MNKKGFTLVELMGVITVLGLITLLIAPTIIKQIRSSKDKIDNVTEKLIYAATDLYLDNKENEYPKLNGSTYCLTLNDLVEDGKLSSPVLDSNGDEISLDKIIAVDVTNNSYNYRMPSSCETEYMYVNGFMVSKDKCIVEGICPSGTKINVQVNDSTNYDFYVIKDTGTKLTLIMDRNLGNKVAWASKADYNDDANYGSSGNNNKGPITALKYLNSQTSDWDNIDAITSYKYDNNLNGTTNTYGYQKLEITNGVEKLTSQDGNIVTKIEGIAKARLITYEEVTALKTANSNTTPTWLYDNLSSSNTTESPWGYWLLSVIPLQDYMQSYYAHSVFFLGGFDYDYVDGYNDRYGVRPVIELSK